MRDALGGTVNIVIIVVFIVFALGYMAFNVNYTKAFRMKDKIISVYEKYKGTCTSNCQTEIGNYAKKIGYQPDTLNCGSGKPVSVNGKNLYCVKANTVGDSSADVIADRNARCYYRVSTKININIPILENLYALSRNGQGGRLNAFYVSGDTATIEKADSTGCGD